MATVKQYLAGARAVARKNGPLGVKEFYERHGVVFAMTGDAGGRKLAVGYEGRDKSQVVTSLMALGREDRGLMLGVLALCDPVEVGT